MTYKVRWELISWVCLIIFSNFFFFFWSTRVTWKFSEVAIKPEPQKWQGWILNYWVTGGFHHFLYFGYCIGFGFLKVECYNSHFMCPLLKWYFLGFFFFVLTQTSSFVQEGWNYNEYGRNSYYFECYSFSHRWRLTQREDLLCIWKASPKWTTSA